MLIGHSLGGIVAQEYVQDIHRSVRGIVFLASPARGIFSETLRIWVNLLRINGVRATSTIFNWASNLPDSVSMRRLFFLPETKGKRLDEINSDFKSKEQT